MFTACANFCRLKVQKAESRRRNVSWSPFAILFAVNVTLKLLCFRTTSLLIHDDSETSRQLSFNITKLFYSGTRHSITSFIPVCLYIQITLLVELPSLEMTCVSSFIFTYISQKLFFSFLVFQFCL